MLQIATRSALRRAGLMALLVGGTVLVGAAGPTTQAAPHQLPMHAVVNGHNVQPRTDQLQALGTADTSSAENAEVDELYRELMQEHHADIRQLG